MLVHVGAHDEWRYEGATEYLPEELCDVMTKSKNRSRSTQWITHLEHAIPLKVVLVKPNEDIRMLACRYWIKHVVNIIKTIDDSCNANGQPKRPSSLTVTIYLWDAKKKLPLRKGDPCDKKHCNTGMCTRKLSDGSCSIIVFRKEDALKTLIHELLHAYTVCDWCNTDPVILNHAAAWSAASNGGDPVPDLRPTESYVDALALLMYNQMYHTGIDKILKRGDTLRKRLLKHYSGTRWVQKTHAFEYFILRHVLLTRNASFLHAFGNGLQQPNRRRLREALDPAGATPALAGYGDSKGKSLASTNV